VERRAGKGGLPLRYVSLEIAGANKSKEIAASRFDVVGEENERRAPWHQASQDFLPLDQRALSEVSAFEGPSKTTKAGSPSRNIRS
jgi:hypothetical protein